MIKGETKEGGKRDGLLVRLTAALSPCCLKADASWERQALPNQKGDIRRQKKEKK